MDFQIRDLSKEVIGKDTVLRRVRASGLEDAFILECSTQRDKLKHYYVTAYMLSGQKLLRTDGQEFSTVDDLADT